MKPRARRLVVGLLAVALLVALGWTWWLPRWIDGVATRAVADAGLGPLELEAASIGLFALRIERLTLGAGAERAPFLVARGVDIAYTPGTLLRGEVKSFSVDGLEANATLRDGVFRLGAFELSGAPDEDAPPASGGFTLPVRPAHVALPDVRLRVDAEDADGRAALLARGRLELFTSARGVRRGELSLGGSVEHAEASAADEIFALTARLDEDGALTLALRAEPKDPASLAPFGADGLDALRLEVDASGRAPAIPGLFDPDAEDAEGAHLTFSGGAVAASGDDAYEVTLRGRLDAEALALHALSARWTRPGVAPLIVEGSGRIRGVAEDVFALEDLALRANVVDLESVDLEDAELRGALRVERDAADGAWRAHASECVAVSAARLTLAGGVTSGKPVTLCLEPVDAPLAELDAEGVRGAFALAPRDVDLRRDAEPFVRGMLPRVEVRVARDHEVRGELILSGGDLALPGPGLDVGGLEGTVHARLDAEERLHASVALRAARVLATGAPELRVPGRVALDARLEDESLSGDVRFDDTLHGRLTAKARFGHSLRTGRGSARVEVGELTLPDAKMAGELLPFLTPYARLQRGRIRLEGDWQWSEDGSSGAIELALDALDLETDYASVEGARGRLFFEQLAPLKLAEGSQLHAKRVEPGASIEDVDIALDASDGKLRLSRASGGVAGGAILGDAVIDLDRTGPDRAHVRLEGSSLADLLALADVEGLAGSGSLAGSFPLVVEGETLRIEGGRLEAGPEGGRLAYRPSVPPASLMAAGEQGRLLVEALRDFRFTRLVLTADGDPFGKLAASLHLAGSNPAVQDGRPIELNIQLGADLTEYARATRLGGAFLAELRERRERTR